MRLIGSDPVSLAVGPVPGHRIIAIAMARRAPPPGVKAIPVLN
jgi:hypothetical protein